MLAFQSPCLLGLSLLSKPSACFQSLFQRLCFQSPRVLPSTLSLSSIPLFGVFFSTVSLTGIACSACLLLRSQMNALPGYDTTWKTEAQGSGAAVSKGNTVTVHATGVVKETGKKFWSTKDPGQQPFTYQAGVGGVITGWDQGCLPRLGHPSRRHPLLHA